MQILTVLSAIGKVEKAVGDFYQWLSEVFADDHEASGFFFRMSMQEKAHANLVSFSKKLVVRSPRDFAEVEADLSAVDELLSSLEAFRQDNPEPDLVDALRFAMEVESSGAENIHRSVVIESNPEVAGVINSLAKADSEHFDVLKRFALERQAVAAG
jgi:rubrerythrin